MSHESPSLADLDACFGGYIPAVIATVSADGTPNVTYLSRAHRVGPDRLALSNQFLSKTARNLADDPRASLLLIDPVTHDEYRLTIEYERTERRGHVFDRLRADVDAIAAITGMQDVFRLRAADIFRVVDIAAVHPDRVDHQEARARLDARRRGTEDLTRLAGLCARLARCQDLDALVQAAVDGLDRELGFHHVHLLLLDEEGRRLYTMASRGFDAESIGAEVVVGEGLIGMAAARCAPVRVGNLLQMAKYSRTVRQSFEAVGGVVPGRAIPMPGLPQAESRLVVPAMSMGELVGVLVADDAGPVAFDAGDEALLLAVATTVAAAIEAVRAVEREAAPGAASSAPRAVVPSAGETVVRHFEVDGSTFLDGEYLIKGVAGRILWSLLRQHVADGRVEFTNRELRLDPSLEMPGYKDNLESRLILLKRRLDERAAPMRIEKTGRGRFRLDVTTALRLLGDASD